MELFSAQNVVNQLRAGQEFVKRFVCISVPVYILSGILIILGFFLIGGLATLLVPNAPTGMVQIVVAILAIGAKIAIIAWKLKLFRQINSNEIGPL